MAGKASTASSARLGRCLLSGAEWRSIDRSLHLSGRESQIVQCIFDDEKEAAIAQELGISAHTVHSHLERLYRKVGVKSRGELLVRVLGEHLLHTLPKTEPQLPAVNR